MKAKYRQETIEIDGEQITVRELNGFEGSHVVKMSKANKEDELLPYITCHCVVDVETGERIFKDSDLGTVSAFPLRVLRAVSDKVIELTGIFNGEKKAS